MKLCKLLETTQTHTFAKIGYKNELIVQGNLYLISLSAPTTCLLMFDIIVGSYMLITSGSSGIPSRKSGSMCMLLVRGDGQKSVHMLHLQLFL